MTHRTAGLPSLTTRGCYILHGGPLKEPLVSVVFSLLQLSGLLFFPGGSEELLLQLLLLPSQHSQSSGQQAPPSFELAGDGGKVS